MPNCFSMTRKSDPHAGPISLSVINDEMRQYFNAPSDPKTWYYYWYEIIGFSLAMGKSFKQIRLGLEEDLKTSQPKEWLEATAILIQIVDWLDENFIPNVWYQAR